MVKLARFLMDILYIELVNADAQAPARWWLCEDAEVSAMGTDSLGDIESAARDQVNTLDKFETVVLLPDREVLYIQVEIPGRSQARIRQAAPFAVEPHLTEEIDDVHIALGAVEKNGAVPCMVINQARMEAYLSVIEGASIRPSVVTTPGMLPDASSDIYLIEAGPSFTVRTEDQLAVVSRDALAPAFSSILVDDLQDTAVKCVGTESMEVEVRQALDQLNVDQIQIEVVSVETLLTNVKSPMELLNLQQGPYAVKDRGGSIYQILNKTALVAAACVIVVSVIFLVQGFWADYKTNELRSESLDVYEAVYDTRDISGNPVFRMQERMGARMDDRSKWLILLESVVGATSGVEIQNLDFNEAQNKMSITFFADSFQEFEAIRSRIEDLGMTVEVNVAEQQKNRVWSRITLAAR